MSGCGRKHRAKHLTRQYLDADAWHGPQEGESIAVCMEAPHGLHLRVLVLSVPESTSATPVDMEAYLSESVVSLPGKFRKVIWLSIRDVIVVQDGSVVLKPSPEQLTNYLKNSSNRYMKALVECAQERAIDKRYTMERMPLYAKTTTTTTSMLMTEKEVRQQTGKDTAVEEGEASCTQSLDHMVNPNRVTIKHRQQFFFGLEEEEEEDM